MPTSLAPRRAYGSLLAGRRRSLGPIAWGLLWCSAWVARPAESSARPSGPPPWSYATAQPPWFLSGEPPCPRADGSLCVAQAQLTPCNCGPRCPPSFELRAPRMILSPGRDRATLLWPRLFVRPFGSRRLVPITPPLLPLSLPLRERAAGALPPQLQFLAPPWPTVDFPVFLPLGDGADLTVAVGSRSDWRGAPRASLRLRARPSDTFELGATVSDTWDWAHRMAARRAARELHLLPQLAADPVWQAIDAQRRALGHRLRGEWQLRWLALPPPAPRAKGPARWQGGLDVDAAWLSDDLVLRDLSILPAERSAAYLPSRAVLRVQRPHFAAALGADWMQNLLSVEPAAGRWVPQLRNTGAAEARTVHRAPALRVSAGVPFENGLVVAGELALARYGSLAWTPVVAPVPAQWVAGLSLGGGMARRLGPLSLAVGLRAEALAAAQAGLPAVATVSPLAYARSSVTLRRRGRDVVHEWSPYLEARALHVPARVGAALAPYAVRRLDERTARDALVQGVVGIAQSLWRTSAAAAAPLVQADVSLPYDFRRRTPMQVGIAFKLEHAAIGQLHAQVGALPARRVRARDVREVDLAYARGFGPVTLSAAYVRLAPNAERLVRTLYDLRGPDEVADPDAPWLHTLRVGYLLAIGQRITSSAMVSLQLPRPATAQDHGLVLPVARPRALDRVTVTSLSVRAGYRSPCACWGTDVYLSAAPRDFVGSLRLLFAFEVGPYRVGPM